MSKEIAKLKCSCGRMISITAEDLGFDEMECPYCEGMCYVPETIEGIEEFNAQEGPSMDATHVRIMAKGEDGMEFCIKNNVAKSNDCYDLIISGAKAAYPEARVWVEDEESSNPHYLRNLVRDMNSRCIPDYLYDDSY
jgi:hypothetical protein